MTLLLFRLLSLPALILLGSCAQRRLGQRWGGRLIGLPLTSLPLLALLDAAHGPSFAAAAATATVGAVAAQSAWCLVYAVMAHRGRSPMHAVCLATAAFAAACGVLFGLRAPLVVESCLGALSILGAVALWPRSDGEGDAVARTPSGAQLVTQMALAATFTALVSGGSTALGARAAGLFGAYPVLTVVLAVATHRRDGWAAASEFLRGAVHGSGSIVTGLTVLALSLEPLGAGLAFAAAIVSSIASQGLSMKRLARRPTLIAREDRRRGTLVASVSTLAGPAKAEGRSPSGQFDRMVQS